MKLRLLVLAVLVLAAAPKVWAQRSKVDEAIKARVDQSWPLARSIWEFAEVGYQEKRSAALLADVLEKAGFKVERGVAKIPTAFTATIGTGSPVIGIMGEYDALPGLSQDAVPFRKPRPETNSGHGCGHHLFGVAALEASLALGEQIKAGAIKGTLRFYGCPAEEGGAARVFMVREGLFKDCSVVLHWHPSSRNSAGTGSNLSRIGVKFQFYGKSAHAAGAPEQGRSALDAIELTNHAAQLLREHTPDFTRIHHIISDGGGSPNVVPDFSEVYYYVRHPDAEVVRQVYERLVKCAQAGALATETKLKIIYLGGTMQMIPNKTLADVARGHLRQLNDITYDAEETKFALRIQETLVQKTPLESVQTVADENANAINKGSTDVSDVSWVVATGGFTTCCWAPGTPAHSWQATAAGGMSIGRKGMLLAARVMAATAWDLFHDARLVADARAEHVQRLNGREYRSLLLPGQDPPLNYREPPMRSFEEAGN